MHLKRFAVGFAALLLALGAQATAAFAAPPPAISYTVGLCDPSYPTRCSSPVPDANVAINTASAATVQLIAAPSPTTKRIYITSWFVIAGGTGNFTLVYGTGTNCGTAQGALTGPIPLTAQVGLVDGVGAGAVIPVPAGNAVCLVNSATVQMSGRMAYTVR